jgi:prolyl oligopeptidase
MEARGTRSPVVEDYHGVSVVDPHRWLERLEEPTVQEWVAEQSGRTAGILARLPGRAGLERRLRRLWDYPRQSVPIKRGGWIFFFRNDGLQNQPVLYVQEALAAPPRVLLDPNAWSEAGTVSLSAWGLAEDGALLAYAMSTDGSDWQTVRVRDVATGRDLPDELRWVRFTTLAFSPDNAGLYYSRYPEPGSVAPEDQNYYQRLYLHRLGTPQAEDRLVYERPDDKDLGCAAEVTRDGRWLVVSVWKGTDKNTELYVQSLAKGPEAPFVPVATGFDSSFAFIEALGDTAYLLTDFEAPHRRVVAVDLARPQREAWRQIVPQGESVIDGATIAGGELLVRMLHRARHRLLHYTLAGRLVGHVELPGLGSISAPYVTFPAISARPDDPQLGFTFTSFLRPHVNALYDVRTRRLEIHPGVDLPFDAERFVARQVFYESRDDTLVSMFLVHEKGLRLDGQNPTFLYGYGGFNVDLTPEFKPGYPLWLEAGGIVAIPNLRGGGEYGEAWHKAGMLQNKQNVFDDFIAAAEYLIENGYTSPPKLAIAGRSNGGLLTAACLLQRPELFGAVVCGVPVIDMLRYHRFTIGRYWIPEYGCADDPQQFPFLFAYSPLHNVKDGVSYPATLITTADTDDRVYPAHALKFAARLQEAQAGEAPILLRIERHAGHGAGTPTEKAIAESADVWAFLFHHLGVRV